MIGLFGRETSCDKLLPDTSVEAGFLLPGATKRSSPNEGVARPGCWLKPRPFCVMTMAIWGCCCCPPGQSGDTLVVGLQVGKENRSRGVRKGSMAHTGRGIDQGRAVMNAIPLGSRSFPSNLVLVGFGNGVTGFGWTSSM